jgi:hypothetical protein
LQFIFYFNKKVNIKDEKECQICQGTVALLTVATEKFLLTAHRDAHAAHVGFLKGCITVSRTFAAC